MLAKGVVSFPFTNSWYLPAFYFGNGCTLFGDGTQEELGADFGGDNAVEVTNYLIDLYNNPNFVVDADGSGLAGMRDGSIKAMFTGSWDAAALKEILGDNMGVAALPHLHPERGRKNRCTPTPAARPSVSTCTASTWSRPSSWLFIWGGAEAPAAALRPAHRHPLQHRAAGRPPPSPATSWWQPQNETFDRTSILQPFVASMSKLLDPRSRTWARASAAARSPTTTLPSRPKP